MFRRIASTTARLLRRRAVRPTDLPGSAEQQETGAVYQVGTMDALLAGAYQGIAAVGELLDHGDFGLGVLEALDGGLVVVDGLAYRLGAEGSAEPLGSAERVAFGMTLPFRPTARRELDWTEGCEVERLVDRMAKGSGLIQAVRVDGTFRRIRMAALPRQEHPYRPYAEIARGATETIWQDVTGTLVGFRTPPSLERLSGAGFRFRFVADDRSFGGRVVDFTVGRGALALHPGAGVSLAVPPQSRPPAPQVA